jgi:hypothetical protein
MTPCAYCHTDQCDPHEEGESGPALFTGEGQACTVEAGVRRERMAALAEGVELGHHGLQLVTEGAEHQREGLLSLVFEMHQQREERWNDEGVPLQPHRLRVALEEAG